MRQNMTGIYNVGVGYAALRGNLGGSSNVGVGNAALFTAGNSNYNTAIGDNAISATAGNSNTAVGYNTLASGGSGCTVLGFNANTSAGSISFGTAIGNGAIVNANNKIRLGDAAVTVVEGPVAYTTSDRRFKTNITEEDVKGLEFIKLLRPVVYNFDARKFTEFLTKNMPGTMAEKHLQTNFENATSIRQSGFIAQEVEEAAAKAGYNFNGLHKPNDENDNYSLAYAQFVVPLVKAVQEQQVMIEKLQEQLDANSQQKKSTDTGLTSPGNQLDGFALDQNIPNPFTHETLINYSIPSQINTAYLAVYDLSGKQVTTFDLDTKLSFINITSNNLAAGIYIYSIVADGKIMDSKRMVVADK